MNAPQPPYGQQPYPQQYGSTPYGAAPQQTYPAVPQYQPQPGTPPPYPAAQQPYPQAGYPSTAPPNPQTQYAPQQYAQAQKYGAPQAAVQGIGLTTEFFPLAWVFFFIKPSISVNGYELPRSPWGRTVIPLPPGQHHVHVHVPYLLPSRLGPADTVIPVHPNQVTETEYKAPLWAFSPGSLGMGPQSYNGVGATIAIAAISFVLFLLVLILPLIATAAA
ncbi:hypothetical protein AAFP35_03845 [Gordonia sp. CPCC 206044]|uniref:hypothetical protein n=1 Tax=Gordonia sp. CPCC 206044 TaxID=3140793 RepID=UPI003AF348B6